MTLPQRFSSNQFVANLIGYADRKAERAAQRLRDKEIDPELLAVAKELERLAVGQPSFFHWKNGGGRRFSCGYRGSDRRGAAQSNWTATLAVVKRCSTRAI